MDVGRVVGEEASVQIPDQINRAFRFERAGFAPGHGQTGITLTIRSGTVEVGKSGPMAWADAEALAVEIGKAAVAARLMAELGGEQEVKLKICTACNKELKPGAVTIPDGPPGRRRHVTGSPACG